MYLLMSLKKTLTNANLKLHLRREDVTEYSTYLELLEMFMCNMSVAGHDMRPAVILLLKSIEVLLNRTTGCLLNILDLCGY